MLFIIGFGLFVVCCDKKMFKTFLGVICFGIRFDIVNCRPFAFRFTFGLENKGWNVKF
jgi:hypothetical protein